jgi:hypothetical protein
MELAVAARAKRNTSLKALQLLKTLLRNSSLSQEQVEANVEQLRSLSPQTNALPRNNLRI